MSQGAADAGAEKDEKKSAHESLLAQPRGLVTVARGREVTENAVVARIGFKLARVDSKPVYALDRMIEFRSRRRGRRALAPGSSMIGFE
jgi:hypothetical protein